VTVAIAHLAARQEIRNMAERSDLQKPSEPFREAGLSLRMPRSARRMIAGHEQLETFSALVRSAVEQGSLQNARLSFMRLNDALEAHFAVEDEHFFPAMRGLKPSLAPELAQLVREHADFRVAMDELRDLLARGSAEAFVLRFEEFCDALSDHEVGEERIIRRAIAE
jgi:hypothetical protein